MPSLGELEVIVNLVAHGVQSGAAEAADSLQTLEESVQGLDNATQQANSNMDNMGRQMSENASAQAIGFAALAGVANKYFSMVVGGVQAGIAAYKDYQNAVQGLSSVASYQQIGQSEMLAALDQVKDKFLDVGSASLALKNLLARGYDVDQAVTTIQRLKDAAAFGRQSNLDLAEAVVSATEGIKNENSILVDNAGVTKNVAKMWEEYAKAHGKSTNQLTQAEKIQAEYLGILKETEAQVGDLAKMGDTLQGAQANSANASREFATAMGEAFAPAIKVAEEAKASVLGLLTEAASASPAATAGIATVAASFTGLTLAVKGFQAFKGFMAQINAMTNSVQIFGLTTKAALGWIGALATVAGVAVGVISGIEQAREKERQRIADLRESMSSQADSAKELLALAERYEELRNIRQKSMSEVQEMASIENQLGQKLEMAGGYVDALKGKYVDLAEAAREAALEQEKIVANNAREVYQVDREDAYKALKVLQMNHRAEAKEIRFSEYLKLGTDVANVEEYFNALDKSFESGMLSIRKDLKIWGLEVGDDVNQTALSVAKAYWENMKKGIDSTEDIDAVLYGAQKLYRDIAKLGQEGLTTNAIEKAQQALKEGLILAPATISESQTQLSQLVPGVRALFESIEDFEGKGNVEDNFLHGLYEQYKLLLEATGVSFEDFLNFGQAEENAGNLRDKIEELGLGMEGAKTNADSYKERLEGLNIAQQRLNEEAEKANQYSNKGVFDPLSASAEECKTRLGDLQEQHKTLDATITKLDQAIGNQKSWKKAIDEYKKTGKATEDYKKALLGLGLDGTASMEQVEQKLTEACEKSNSEMAGAQEEALKLKHAYMQVEGAANVDASVQVETAGAIGKLNGLISIAKAAQSVLAALGILNTGASKGGGGGGGGGKKESEYQKAIKALDHDRKMDAVDLNAELGRLLSIRNEIKLTTEEELDLEERIHAVRKKIQEERLRKDYELIEHKKALNQINTEQEVKMLEEMARKHRFTNEQRMEYDRKLYEARERLRREKEEKISGIGEGIVQALRKQYEQMQDTEREALDKSLDSFNDWADGRIKAIEKQIEALDALSSKEDEEAKTAEELRKINRLKEAMNFERDEYNRAQLAEQIRQAEVQQEERLRKKAKNDEKTALREQIKAIQEEKEAKRASVEEQRKQIEDTYKALTEQISIEAEARKMLLEKSQQDVVAFIAKFVPEYDALGRTLGEKWLEGFERSIGGFFGYFEGFTKQFHTVQESLAKQALAAVAQFWQGRETGQTMTTVNQTVNFNQPIESPGQVAKRMRDVAEELVYGG